MKLHVSKHGQKISEYEFPASLGIHEIIIGRSQSCHILIDDPMISREHLECLYSDGVWSISKKSPLASIDLNGKSIESSPLNVGDVVSLLDYTITIKSLETDEKKAEPISSIVVGEKKTEELDDYTSDNSEDFDRTELLQSESGHGLEDEEDIYGEESAPVESESVFEEAFSEDSPLESDDHDDFSFGEDDDQNSAYDDVGDKTGVFTNFATFYLKLFGEDVPYDRFKIQEGDTFIGRKSDKCQIVLKEDDVSSVHAVIKRNKVSCYLEDLNSANGTLLNGERVNKAELINGDEFIIGSTTFTVEVTSDLMKEEKGRLMPVEANQSIDVEEIVEEEVNFGELNADASAVPGENASKSIFKNPAKRKKLIYGALGLMLLWVFLDDGSDPPPKSKAKTEESKEQATNNEGAAPVDPNKKVFTKEQMETLEASYQVGVRSFEENSFAQARDEFARVSSIDPAYKNVETYLRATDKALVELNKAEERKREEEKRRILAAEVKELLEKAKQSFKEENIELTQFYINKISEKDPENLEVPYLRIEVETYIKRKKEEEEKIRLAKEARDKMLEALKPGETFYYSREWYKAILKLEDFTRLADMDTDLIKKAADMLEKSRENLRREVDPMLGEARSLKEGQDLKGAYELYSKIYEIDQSNTEALDEMDGIRTKLNKRSRKVYREAIIAESLSLFDEAKEKFQEVQQISPSDSVYFKKATEKLKQYFE